MEAEPFPASLSMPISPAVLPQAWTGCEESLIAIQAVLGTLIGLVTGQSCVSYDAWTSDRTVRIPDVLLVPPPLFTARQNQRRPEGWTARQPKTMLSRSPGIQELSNYTPNETGCQQAPAPPEGNRILMKEASQYTEQVLLTPTSLQSLVLDANLGCRLLLQQVQSDVA